MMEVTEPVPTRPVRAVRKDQGRFIRKRSGRGQSQPPEQEPAADNNGGSDDFHPSEHIDTYV